jgi:hypothetical protein
VSLIERSFREKIVLVGVTVPPQREEETERHLDELALLVDTAGADEAARVIQRRDRPDPATYVGRGKAGELRDLSLAVDADTVVFDDELSPAQSRNLEKILGRTAIDRTAVILTSSPRMPTPRKARPRWSWLSCGIACRACGGGAASCPNRLVGSAPGGRARRSWRSIAGGWCGA